MLFFWGFPFFKSAEYNHNQLQREETTRMLESRINEYYIMKNQLNNIKSQPEFLVGETFRQDSLVTTNKDKRGGL